jgi:hypothetical protein
MFYPNGIKILPVNIGEILTPAGLAYWAQDDGYKQGAGFRFATECFTLEEVELLVAVMKTVFDLDCSVQKAVHTNQFRIYVRSNSMDRFRSLVAPYFIPSMLYKLN